jgi:hypothetical protein
LQVLERLGDSIFARACAVVGTLAELVLECFEGYVNGAQLVFEVVRKDTR